MSFNREDNTNTMNVLLSTPIEYFPELMRKYSLGELLSISNLLKMNYEQTVVMLNDTVYSLEQESSSELEYLFVELSKVLQLIEDRVLVISALINGRKINK